MDDEIYERNTWYAPQNGGYNDAHEQIVAQNHDHAQLNGVEWTVRIYKCPSYSRHWL